MHKKQTITVSDLDWIITVLTMMEDNASKLRWRITDLRDNMNTPLISFNIGRSRIKAESKESEVRMPAQLTLLASEEVDVGISAVDKYNNPAQIDGTPTWEASDTSLLEIVPGSDPMSVTLRPVGPAGVVQATVKADADLGEGVREISDFVTLTIEPAEALGFGFQLGTPREKPVT